MDENDKMKQVIQKYNSYFKNFSGDVAYTAAEYLVFLEYDKKSEDYYGFIRFKTADELEKVVMSELENGVNCTFEMVDENMHMSFKQLDNEIYNGQDMDGLTKLTRELELLRGEYYKKGKRLELLLKILSGTLLDKNYKS